MADLAATASVAMSLRDEISKLIKEKRDNLESGEDRSEERFRLIKQQIADIRPALEEISKSVERDIIRFETLEWWVGVTTIVVLVLSGDFRLKDRDYDGSDLESFLRLRLTGGRGGFWYVYPFFPPDGDEYWVLETRALGYKNTKRFNTATDLLAHLVPEIADHFLIQRISGASTEVSLQILAYNMKRAINLVGTRKIMETIAP